MVVANEGRRGLEAIRSAVGMEDLSLKSWPLQLFDQGLLADVSWRTEGRTEQLKDLLQGGALPPER